MASKGDMGHTRGLRNEMFDFQGAMTVFLGGLGKALQETLTVKYSDGWKGDNRHIFSFTERTLAKEL